MIEKSTALMFFVLSKVLLFLTKPLNWVITFGLLGIVSKNNKWKKRSARWGILTLLIFTNPLIINTIYRLTEEKYLQKTLAKEPYTVGILLGGFLNQEAIGLEGTQNISRYGNRLTETTALYHTGKIKHILISGGSGEIIGETVPEAITTRDYLLRAGVPDSVIIVEARARNTRENALFTKEILDSLGMGNAPCLMITSAFHIKRAQACFAKIGMNVDAYPAGFFAEGASGNWLRLLEPKPEALLNWNYIIKEWIGMVAYRMKGYI